MNSVGMPPVGTESGETAVVLPSDEARLAKARQELARVRGLMEEARRRRGGAETMELKVDQGDPVPELADIRLLREQTKHTLSGGQG